MTSEQFVYWLQGFLEIAEPKGLTSKQRQIIQDHLKLVFDKQTPDRFEYIPSPNYQPYPSPVIPGAPTIICETTSTIQTPSDLELDATLNQITNTPPKTPRNRGGSRVLC
jgi:hypothetical protein